MWDSHSHSTIHHFSAKSHYLLKCICSYWLLAPRWCCILSDVLWDIQGTASLCTCECLLPGMWVVGRAYQPMGPGVSVGEGPPDLRVQGRQAGHILGIRARGHWPLQLAIRHQLTVNIWKQTCLTQSQVNFIPCNHHRWQLTNRCYTFN